MPICHSRKNGTCLLATKIALERGSTSQVLCRDDAFQACTKLPCAYQVNSVVCSIAISHLRKEGVEIGPLIKEFKPFLNNKDCQPDGIGTELHKIIQESGYEMTPGCHCLSLMRKMNQLGPEWCQTPDGEKEISRGVYSEFVKRHPLLSKALPRRLVRKKIKVWLNEALKRWSTKSKQKSC